MTNDALSAPFSRPAAPVATKRLILPTVVLAAVIFGSTVLSSSGGIAPVDAVVALAGIYVVLASRAKYGDDPLWRVLTRIVGPVLFFAVVITFYSIAPGGDTSRLLSDLASFAYCFVPLLLIRVGDEKQIRIVTWAIALTGLALLVSVYIEDSVRPSGLMRSPNLSATWFAAYLVYLAVGAPRLIWPLRIALIVAFSYGVLLTQGYSSIVGALAAISYFGVRTLRGFPRAGMLISAGLALRFGRDLLPYLPGGDRSERSSGTRLEIWSEGLRLWQDSPLGIGYGAFVHRAGAEMHNDYLSLLVETGPLGAASFILVLIGFWRVGGDATRAMVIFFAVNSALHNVMNYRHLWLALVLCIASDMTRRRNVQMSNLSSGAKDVT